MTKRLLQASSLLGGTAAAVTSAAASICCIGPLAIALLGVNGAILAAAFKPYRVYFLSGSLVLLAAAFWSAYRPAPVRDGAACPVRAGRWTRLVLWVALGIWIGAVVIQYLANRLWLRRGGLMTIVAKLGLIPVGVLLALTLRAGPGGTFIALDGAAQPLKDAFNADAGKVRLLMYVSPTCGECLRGAKQGQKDVLATIDDANLRIYVVWAPKNGGRQQDVGRVTQIVTDPRAAQYWDGHRVLTDAYDRMLALSGPCAGIFMLYGRQARWEGATPPRADYLEDAHAREFDRPYPQYDAQRFANKVREMLNTRSK